MGPVPADYEPQTSVLVLETKKWIVASLLLNLSSVFFA